MRYLNKTISLLLIVLVFRLGLVIVLQIIILVLLLIISTFLKPSFYHLSNTNTYYLEVLHKKKYLFPYSLFRNGPNILTAVSRKFFFSVFLSSSKFPPVMNRLTLVLKKVFIPQQQQNILFTFVKS